MNVTIAIDELDMGGAQHVVYELLKHIDTVKYNITVICTDGRVDSLLEKAMIGLAEERLFSIVFLKNHKFIGIQTRFIIFNKIYNKLRRIFIDLCIILDLTKELRKSNPDIVHAHPHGIWAFYWTVFHNVPMVTTIHTNPQATFPRETEKFGLKMSIFFHKNILIGISAYNMKLIKNYWRLADTDVGYVNNGIDLDNFYTKPHELFTFINVSRQDENKNQSLILKAFARLYWENPQFSMRLFLVGYGVTHFILKNLSKELKIDDMVIFTGYVSSSAEYLAISDVYISSAHREGLSLSVLEAMASNLPVIATDTGGVRDLAQENGILILDDDEEGLYHAMKSLRDNDELRIFKAGKSREIVRAFSAETMAKEYSLIYDKFAIHR
jgi:glycosyltransferase involved in cell wall biosynthesis